MIWSKKILIEDIKNKLTRALNPNQLDVIDESSQHFGHVGWKEGVVTHIKIDIIADSFNGLSKVQRHKVIYQILGSEINNGLHAVRISAKTLNE